MRTFKKLGSITIAALLLVGATGSPSSAAFDAAEAKCRSAISKNFTKAISQGNKAISGCHKDRDSGKIGAAIDCNLLTNANADSKGKFAKAQAKVVSGIQKSCIDSNIDLDAMADYTSCPEPCNTDLALPNPLTSYANLSACLACVAADIAESNGSATLGLPAGVPLVAADAACHGAIGKNYGKLLSTIMKERTKCQNTAEKKDGAMSLTTTGCGTADPKLKIAGGQTKAEAAVDSSCGGANLANIDSCDMTTVAALKTCLDTETDNSGDDGVFDSYELAATICPIGVDSLVLGKSSQAAGATNTSLELGWTGIAHLADLPDNYYISVDVTCPNTSPPCGSCTIDGISTAGQQYASFTRCSNDFTIPCDAPFLPDTECSGNLCNYVLGPPLPISAGNNPTCSINRLALDVTGTTDPDAGTGEIQLSLSTLVHLGEGLSNPCPVCSNDPTPFDGLKGGVCVGGANDTEACDVMGFSASFANAANNEGLSLDCPSDQLANISGSGLKIPLELTTGATSLPFANACDSPLGSLSCACGVCSGDITLPCRDNAECAAAAAGTCTSIGSGVARVPNECGDGVCSVLSGEIGTCLAGPTDRFCSGLLDAQGDGFIGCTSNADCTAVNSVCGGNCGTCTITRQRACFLNPIDAAGVADTDNPTLVSTFCLPPTNNAAINGVTGTPGPVRVAVEQLTNLRY